MKREPDAAVTVFLMADAVLAAKGGQNPPDGYYKIERMLKRIAYKDQILLCGTCMDVRGLGDGKTMDGAWRSAMDGLAKATVEVDKVLVF